MKQEHLAASQLKSAPLIEFHGPKDSISNVLLNHLSSDYLQTINCHFLLVHDFFLLQDVGAASDALLHAALPLTNNCDDTFPKTKINEQKQICAGKRGWDSCKGDSGGPLVLG